MNFSIVLCVFRMCASTHAKCDASRLADLQKATQRTQALHRMRLLIPAYMRAFARTHMIQAVC